MTAEVLIPYLPHFDKSTTIPRTFLVFVEARFGVFLFTANSFLFGTYTYGFISANGRPAKAGV
jgi:hypothetical protein